MSPNVQTHQFDLSNVNLSQQAILAIRTKMEQMARELAQNEELGLDEATLMRILEAKTEKLI